MKEIIKKLRYEFVGEGTNIFKYKDVGDKLYLIIDGLVSVWVPQETTDKKLLGFKNLKQNNRDAGDLISEAKIEMLS